MIAPISTTQCQVEITPSHGPFILGPKPRPYRCKNKPMSILSEKEPGDDGQRGRMSVCRACLDVAKEQGVLQTCDVIPL
jgi:hypothetical protein